MTASRVTTNPEAAPAGEALDAPVLAIISDTTSQVLLFALLWIGVGLATAVFLRRREHEFGPNAALGVILGPLFVFLAYDMIRRRESEKPITVSPPSDGPGPAVLIVAIGDLEAPEVALEALENLDRVGSVTAAVPVEYEIAERVHALGAAPPPSERLDELAAVLADFVPGLMMLPGRIEKSIPLAVRATDADLVLLVGSECQSAAPGLEENLPPRVIRVGV